MGNSKKKLLSWLLSSAMALSVVPFSGVEAEAAGTDVGGKILVTEADREGGLSFQPQRVSVHDPSVIEASDGSYYIFGSHMGVAKTTDFVNWQTTSINGEDEKNGPNGYYAAPNGIVCSYEDAFKENALTGETTLYKADGTPYTVNFGTYDITEWHKFDGTGDSATMNIRGNQWAPDIIYNTEMHKYCLYQSINGGNHNSAIVLLTSDTIEGPYVYQAPVVFTGFQPGNDNENRSWRNTDLALALHAQGIEIGDTLPARYDVGSGQNKWGDVWPHAIDPCVSYDEDGKLWLTYGSWSGGIYILELDEKTGLRDYSVVYESDYNAAQKAAVTSDPYLGKKIAGGYYVSGEGSYIEKIGNYWYLFMSYGFYSQNGGYEMRVFRSENIDGPYVDQDGNSAIFTNYQMNYGPNSQTTRGQKLITGYKWDGMEKGETAQGHNSAIQLEDGRAFLVCHTKFTDGSADHQIRVHELYVTKEGWLAASPLEYGKKTSSDYQEKEQSEIVGTYHLIEGDYKLDYENLAYVSPVEVSLTEDGKVLKDGEEAGSWSIDGKYASIVYHGTTYSGGFLEQDRYETGGTVLAFTGNGIAGSRKGVNLWAVKTYDDKYAVIKNMDYSLPFGTAVNLELPETGEFGVSVEWSSSKPEILSDDGVVTRAEDDTKVALTRTVIKGNYYYQKTYQLTVYGTKGENADRFLDYHEIGKGTRLAAVPMLSEKTGVSIRFKETGLESDWTSIFNSDDGLSIYLSVLNYAGGNAFEAAGTLSAYAEGLGFDADTAWKIFTDKKQHAVEISYNVDGSVDFYRDGEWMLSYPAGTAVGSSKAKYAVKAIAKSFAAGKFTVKYPVTNLSIGYAKDYEPSGEIETETEKKTVLATVGEKKEDGSYVLPWYIYKNFYRMEAPAGDFEATLSFHQDAKFPEGNWQSFAVGMTEDLTKENHSNSDWYLRSDHYSNSTFSGSEVYMSANYNWDTFQKDMQDIDVEMVIKRVGSDILVTSDILTKDGKNYWYTAMAVGAPTGALAVCLGGQDCFLTINKATMDALSLSKEAGSDTIAVVGTKNGDTYTLGWNDYDHFYNAGNLTGDFEAVMVFDHASQSANQWDAFALAARGEDFLWHTRADAYVPDVNTGLETSQFAHNIGGDWASYKETNKASKITLFVTRAGKTISYIAHIEGTNGKKYEYAAAAYGGSTEPLELLLGGENCQLNIKRAGAKSITRTRLKEPVKLQAPEAAAGLTYNGKEQALVTAGTTEGGKITYALGKSGDTAPAESAYSEDIPKMTDAGTYYVWYQVKGDVNHESVAPAQIEAVIGKKALTEDMLTVEETAQEVAYTGKAMAPEITVSDMEDGQERIGRKDYEVSGDIRKTDAGKYTITVTGTEDGNYSGTITASWKILQKKLTIQAEDYEKVTGMENPAFTYRVDGLIEGDDAETILSGALACAADESTAAGQTLEITQGTLGIRPEVTNYVIDSFIPGTLKVKEAAIGAVTVQYAELSKDSVKLYGAVSPGAYATEEYISKVGFGYKKKSDASWLWEEMDFENGTHTFEKTLTGLSGDTDYEYRSFVLLKNGTEKQCGESVSFHTLKAEAGRRLTGKINVQAGRAAGNGEDTRSVIVTVENGNDVVAAKELGGLCEDFLTAGFENLPDGVYNVVCRTADGEFVETKLLEVTEGKTVDTKFLVPKGKVATVVEVKTEDTPKTAVEGLGDILTEQEYKDVADASKEIEIKLEVEKKEESGANAAEGIDEIKKQLNDNEKLDTILDLSLMKVTKQLDRMGNVTNQKKSNLGDSNETVIKIAIPYKKGKKSGIVMFRYHGKEASRLDELKKPPVNGYIDGTYFVDSEYIFLYAKGFSTYVVGYEKEKTGSGTGYSGGYYVVPVSTAAPQPQDAKSPEASAAPAGTTVPAGSAAGTGTAVPAGSAAGTAVSPETQTVGTAAPGMTAEPSGTAAPEVTSAPEGTVEQKGTASPAGTKEPDAVVVTAKEKQNALISMNAGLKAVHHGKRVTLSWGEVSGAARYKVYATYCSSSDFELVKTVKGTGKNKITIKKLNGKKIRANQDVKLYVAAYKGAESGEKMVYKKMAASITVYVVGKKNTEYSDAKKIKLSKTSYTLKAGKKRKIQAKIVLQYKNRKSVTDIFVKEFRFASTNPSVAFVDEQGQITARKKGKCNIYIYARNGLAEKITVKVK